MYYYNVIWAFIDITAGTMRHSVPPHTAGGIARQWSIARQSLMINWWSVVVVARRRSRRAGVAVESVKFVFYYVLLIYIIAITSPRFDYKHKA